MNPRTLKETRTLLPILGGTVLALLLEGLFVRANEKSGIQLTTLIIGSVFLGAVSFGEEFQHRTMLMLLSQPVRRQRIWREKMTVIGLALLAAMLACMVFAPTPPHDDWAWYMIVALVPVFVYCSAPRGALLAKSTLIGALTVFSIPLVIWLGILAIYAAIQWLCQCWGHTLRTFLDRYYYGNMLVNSFDQYYLLYLAPVVLIYLVLSHRSGYRSFLNLELIDAQAQDIRLPARIESALEGPVSKIMPGYTGPVASLLRKELRLQHTGFLLAGFFCVLAAVELPLWFAFRSQENLSDLFAALLGANVIMLMAVVPMVIAGATVAEEKSLGIATAQRALPPSALKQWMIKLAVMFGSCILLGVVLPLLLLMVGAPIFGYWQHGFPLLQDGTRLSIDIACASGYLLFLSIVLYSSTASTSTFRALVMAIALITLCLTSVWGSASLADDYSRLGASTYENQYADIIHSPLVVAGPAMAVMMLLVLFLAYRNFRDIDVPKRTIWLQSALIVAVFAPLGVVAALISRALIAI